MEEDGVHELVRRAPHPARRTDWQSVSPLGCQVATAWKTPHPAFGHPLPARRGEGNRARSAVPRPLTRPSATLSPLGGARGTRGAGFALERTRAGRARRRPILGSAPRGFSQLMMKLLSRGSALCRNMRPDLIGLAHADQGNRRPGLPFRQLVLRLLADHRTVPDRGRDRRPARRNPGDRERDHAIAL